MAFASLCHNTHLVLTNNYPLCIFWRYSFGITRSCSRPAFSSHHQMALLGKGSQVRWEVRLSPHFFWRRRGTPFLAGCLNRGLRLEITFTVSKSLLLMKKKTCSPIPVMPLRGESKALRSSRGFFAIFYMSAIMGVSVFSIIVGPIRQSLLIPVKDIRSMDVPVDLYAEPSVWNVVVVSFDRSPITMFDFDSASPSNARLALCTTWTGLMTRNFIVLWMYFPYGTILVSFCWPASFEFWQTEFTNRRHNSGAALYPRRRQYFPKQW
jgi:hypothetical protein